MSNYKEFLTKNQHQEIIQRITDVYGQDYLLGHEFAQIYEEFANSVLHEEEEQLYLGNNI